MKRLNIRWNTVLWSMTLLCHPGLLRAQEPEPLPVRHHLPIVEVTVYEDRALVTREGEITADGVGVQNFLVGGLPPALLETSLRAGLSDPERGRVISVSSDVQRHREIQDTELRAVEEERRSVERQVAEVDDDLERVTAKDKYLGAYQELIRKAVSERTGGGDEPQTGRWAEALRFVREGRSAAFAARREADAKRRVLLENLKDLNAEVQRLRRPQERSERLAEVAVEVTRVGRLHLKLSYVIEGAGWSPRYDARFDQDSGELAVTYFGEIRQRTGEDWERTRLILSTARPSVGASRPELLPIRLAAVEVPDGAEGKGIAHRQTRVDEFESGINGVEVLAEEVNENMTRFSLDLDVLPEEELDLLVAESRENATSATFTVPGWPRSLPMADPTRCPS